MSRLLVSIAVVMMCSVFSAFVKAEQVPLEAFSRLPQFKGVSMSPDGSKIAMERNSKDEDLAALMTMDMKTGKVFYLLRADNKKIKINWCRWANNNDLLVSARYEVAERGVKYYKTRLYIMPFDGQGEKP